MYKAPLVSIILPLRSEATYVLRGLQALADQDYPSDRMEILIADGMSTDGTPGLISEWSNRNPQLTLLLLDNPGKIVPTGMNIALCQANGDIIIRVDGHCIIAPDYVSRCVKHIQGDGVDGVGGPMESVGETPLARAIAVAMSSPFGVGNSAFRTTSGRSGPADTVPFPAFSRQMIARAGFYDEELVRNQDDEYNYRVREMGGKILLAHDVRSTYFSRASLKGLWNQYFQYGYWKVRVLQKHPRQMQLRQFVPPCFVAALLSSAILSFISPVGFIIPASYVLANLSASLLTAAKRGWRYLPLLPVTFAILHLSYGLGFLVGLVKFANRWGDRLGKVPAWDGIKPI